jgi:hypothetical protein
LFAYLDVRVVLLVEEYGSIQIPRRKLRPQHVHKGEATMRRLYSHSEQHCGAILVTSGLNQKERTGAYLPQKKIAQPLLAGGADEDVQRRTSGRVHALLQQIAVDVPAYSTIMSASSSRKKRGDGIAEMYSTLMTPSWTPAERVWAAVTISARAM